MQKIHKLSPQLADMIAAGEVVERPASAVKEMVENAIDAGAKKIIVEIKNGGITFMRITDDGCGMSAEDAAAAFLRHATSKISSQEDLTGIQTMGFRGEALAAISAVSKIDMLTRTEDEPTGVSVHVEAGNVTKIEPAGCPVGTTIIVRNLFYNTPARMKFLKRDSVEGSYISGAVQRQALGHPEVAFRFIRDGKTEMETPGDGQLLSAIYSAMGRAAAKDMVEIRVESGSVRVTGYVGKPTATRGSRSYQHFFVNGRYIKSGMLAAALEEAYRNRMMTGRFPVCVLHVTVPADAVDVNVHPAKTEVKFLRENEVFNAIHYGVKRILDQTPDRPEIQADTGGKSAFFQTMTAEEFRKQFAQQETIAVGSGAEADSPGGCSAAAGPQKQIQQVPPAAPAAPQTEPAGLFRQYPAPGKAGPEEKTAVPAEREAYSETVGGRAGEKAYQEVPLTEKKPFHMPVTAAAVDAVQMEFRLPEQPRAEMPDIPLYRTKEETAADAPYRIVGEAFRTYIIVEQGSTLLYIDKHAAHERILFEKFRSQPHEIMSQILLEPVRPLLALEDQAVLLEQKAYLEQMGFTLYTDPDGGVLVSALPEQVGLEELDNCLQEMAQDLRNGRKEDPKIVFDELLHTVACKAAIKGGWDTDPIEIAALVEEVLSREDLKYCPHGRPICIQMTQSRLEHQFKRS